MPRTVASNDEPAARHDVNAIALRRDPLPRQTRRYRAEQYVWLLTADPPICREGRPIEVLQNCDRQRRNERCWCRLLVRDVADDLEQIGRGDLAEFLESGLEADDVSDVAGRLRSAATLAQGTDECDRLIAVSYDLERIADRGSGLTDRYSDDVDA